jgi:hypothetical protein
MLALLPLEVDSVFTPRMQIGNKLKTLAEPRVKRMGDPETSAQTVRSRRS